MASAAGGAGRPAPPSAERRRAAARRRRRPAVRSARCPSCSLRGGAVAAAAMAGGGLAAGGGAGAGAAAGGRRRGGGLRRRRRRRRRRRGRRRRGGRRRGGRRRGGRSHRRGGPRRRRRGGGFGLPFLERFLHRLLLRLVRLALLRRHRHRAGVHRLDAVHLARGGAVARELPAPVRELKLLVGNPVDRAAVEAVAEPPLPIPPSAARGRRRCPLKYLRRASIRPRRCGAAASGSARRVASYLQ